MALIFLFSMFGGVAAAQKEGSMERLQGKKIVMIIAAERFRDEELNVPLIYFRKKGARVDVASSVKTEVKGVLGSKAVPDMFYTEIKVENYDVVVFVGGGGSVQYWHDPAAHNIAREAVAKGKLLGAICYAPVTLANSGVLKNRKVTVFADERSMGEFERCGLKTTGSPVEVDGRIVTASGPQAAEQFALAIESAL